MVTGNVRQGRSTNRPEHYGNFECRQDLHENSRLGNIPVNSRVCRKSHVFAFSVLSHVRFFRHFHKACHIRRICRIFSQTISGDPSCAANMFPLLFGRQETACSSATSVRPVPRPINWRIISALPLWFPVSGPMLRLFHIVLVLGNRVKILKLPLYSIQFLHQITTSCLCGWNANMLYSIQFLHQITTRQLAVRDLCCCIVSNFYIKSQLEVALRYRGFCCIVSNFYIKSQPIYLFLKGSNVV